MQRDPELAALRGALLALAVKYRYSYNFTWYGRPIIQLPEDIVMLQELVLSVKPELIIETGIAHGGSLVLSASMLELLGRGNVVGIDIEIRPHNAAALAAHPLSRRITTIEGSSTDPQVVERVRALAAGKSPVMVILDSNHTHAHVLNELRLYAPLVTRDSYLVVFDTVIEQLPAGSFPDRPWDKGNNPATAVRQFLSETDRFAVDTELEARMLLTAAPGGWLRCVKD
jgi:cephalosporin hydroxylase